jgi:hypothetical protein
MRHKDSMPRTVNTIAVPSVDEFAEKGHSRQRHGGGAKTAIPGVGYKIYSQDTEESVRDPPGGPVGEIGSSIQSVYWGRKHLTGDELASAWDNIRTTDGNLHSAAKFCM